MADDVILEEVIVTATDIDEVSNYYQDALSLVMQNQMVHSNFYSVTILPSASSTLGNNFFDTFNYNFRDLKFICEAAELPGRNFAINAEQKIYGPTEKFPTMTTYNDMLLSFVCLGHRMYPKDLFEDWMEFINPRTNYNFKYKNRYTAKIIIKQYTPTGHEVYRAEIIDAYPYAIQPQQLNFGASSHQTLQVAFNYLEFIPTHFTTPVGDMSRPNIITQFGNSINNAIRSTSNFITEIF